jgi:hypothetical protein
MYTNNIKCADYLLTIIQHTYCSDCMWLKGKITDVYHASGIVRGDDSMSWRVQILSPPWDRKDRAKEFPRGFATVDVPALKLEVDNKIILATQTPGLINELLQKLKWLLINRETNQEIKRELEEMARGWVESPDQTVCRLNRNL